MKMEKEDEDGRFKDDPPRWGELTLAEKMDLLALFILLPIFVLAVIYMVVISP